MTALFSWLARTFVLYLLLALAIGIAMAVWPNAPAFIDGWREDTAGIAEVNARITEARNTAQDRLDQSAVAIRNLSLDQLDAQIAQKEAERRQLSETLTDQDAEWLAHYRPSRIVERKQVEIEIALRDAELAMLRAARAPREELERAEDFLERNPTKPTTGAIAAAQRQCRAARAALANFNARTTLSQQAREMVLSEGSELEAAARRDCTKVQTLTARRAAAEKTVGEARRARAALADLAAQPLPQDFAKGVSRTVLRDIAIKALLALLAILLVPPLVRVVLYYALAPLAEKWPPMQFEPRDAPSDPAPIVQSGAQSRVSLAVTLEPEEEALVRQDFLQSTSLKGEKRTRWLLNWASPFTSLASGMWFLTAVRGAGEEVLISAVKDPLAELSLFEIPAGNAVIIRPSALAGIVQNRDNRVRITAHWRLFSLPAWLTFQLRYLAFHGPVKVALKGGRGVRVEAAQRGRIVGQSQMLGFTTQCRYSVIRCETFWPYFFGQESLLKDRIDGEKGVLLVEETPLAGASGGKRGLAGLFDAALKLFGV